MVFESITPFVFPATALITFDAENCDGAVPIPASTPFVKFFEDRTSISTFFDASEIVGGYDTEEDIRQVVLVYIVSKKR